MKQNCYKNKPKKQKNGCTMHYFQKGSVSKINLKKKT